MAYIPNLIFALLLAGGIGFFVKNVRQLWRNINLGRSIDRSDRKSERWMNMIRIALGQSKMVKRPVSGFLHVIVYVGFILINIELLEIVLDGLLGTHRLFAPILGPSVYGFLIGSFEVMAFLVLVAVLLFWTRRNVMKIKRFLSPEMTGWPKNDANIILYFEVVLMSLFLLMNASDTVFQEAGVGNIISGPLSSLFDSWSEGQKHLFERVAWWLHIGGILIFLNYLYYSKHLHILLAFPNTFFADLNAKGAMNNLESVKKEVDLMMDPNADPFAATDDSDEEIERFGAADVMDLNKVQLMNAYTCTECGRCTSSCPANQTGKLLSPRAIMMKTRDRLEEVGKRISAGLEINEDNQLLGNYISPEELWACTSCNACVQECPVDINPLSIIMDMRRYMVMEESSAPQELNMMMTNIENNGAPWQYNQMDRLNWKDE